MAILTNEQIQKLTKEQQEKFAAVELRVVQKRQKLLEQARPYSGFILMPFVVALVCSCFFLFLSDDRILLGISVYALFGLIQFHAIWTNRRLNALLELLDPDMGCKPQQKQSTDENVA